VVPSNIILDRGPGPATGRGDLGVGTLVKICIANCGQTVIDSGMVTIENLQELSDALSNYRR